MDLYSQRVSLKGYMVILALNSNFKIFVSEGTRYRFDAIHPYTVLIISKRCGRPLYSFTRASLFILELQL